MELKVCEYCGTEYDANLPECPLCGKAVFRVKDTADAYEHGYGRSASAGGKRLAPRQKKTGKNAEKAENPYSIPKWMMVVICVILAMAVFFGAVFAIYNLDWFGWQNKPLSNSGNSEAAQPGESESASEQEDATEEQYTNEEDYVNNNPAENQTQEQIIACTGLTLASTSITFDEPDLFYNIAATREPADCNEELVFTSSDESIATVNQHGKIVAVNAGSAVITVSCGSQSATCLVTCDFEIIDNSQLAEQLPPQLNNTDMTFFAPGEQFVLVVLNIADDAEVSFVSEDPNVASVSSSGTVTAKGSGTTTITANLSDGTSLDCIVRCKLDESAESTEEAVYTISHSDVTMAILGEYFRLTLKDENGDRVSGLSWKTSDSSVCTVDADGIVKATGKGTAYVSTTYGGVSYQCIVRCNIK